MQQSNLDDISSQLERIQHASLQIELLNQKITNFQDNQVKIIEQNVELLNQNNELKKNLNDKQENIAQLIENKLVSPLENLIVGSSEAQLHLKQLGVKLQALEEENKQLKQELVNLKEEQSKANLVRIKDLQCLQNKKEQLKILNFELKNLEAIIENKDYKIFELQKQVYQKFTPANADDIITENKKLKDKCAQQIQEKEELDFKLCQQQQMIWELQYKLTGLSQQISQITKSHDKELASLKKKDSMLRSNLSSSEIKLRSSEFTIESLKQQLKDKNQNYEVFVNQNNILNALSKYQGPNDQKRLYNLKAEEVQYKFIGHWDCVRVREIIQNESQIPFSLIKNISDENGTINAYGTNNTLILLVVQAYTPTDYFVINFSINLRKTFKNHQNKAQSIYLIVVQKSEKFYVYQQFLIGNEVTYNNYYGCINEIKSDINTFAQSFSYYSYHITKGNYLVNNIQGVGKFFTNSLINKRDDQENKAELVKKMFLTNFEEENYFTSQFLQILGISKPAQEIVEQKSEE